MDLMDALQRSGSAAAAQRSAAQLWINPLESTSNYSGTSNDMKLVHWPRVFFRIWNMGVSTNPWGSLPFPSLLLFPFPLPPLPLSPSFPPEAGGVLCESWGVLTPLRGCVGNSLHWPLMGWLFHIRLLHLVQQGRDWAGPKISVNGHF